MRKILFGVLLTASFVGIPDVQAESCSLGSRESMLNYMQEFATGFPAFSRAVAMGTNPDANQRLASFREAVANCELNLQLTGMSQCFSSANRMAEMNARRRSISGLASQGMEMSDQDYQAQLPSILKTLPPELSNGLPSNWREVAAQKGWQAVSYRSRTVGNPGPSKSYMRVLFKIPGKPYERWIQFTIGELNDPTRPEQLVDAIAVNTETKQISFNQFWRNTSGTDPQPRSSGAHGSGGNMDSCVTCHPNGMREISPAPGSYNAKDAPVIEAMNASMQAYKRLNWQGLDMDAYGPALGQTDGCVRCHNGYTGDPAVSRGALTVMTAASNFRHKLVDDLSMTPTTLSSRDEALQYLKNIPLNIPEEARQKLMMDVYGGSSPSSFDHTRRTLDWLRDNIALNGSPYLSAADHTRYLAALSEMRLENTAVASNNPALTPGRASEEETREWLLKDCDIPPPRAVPPPAVVDSDGADEPANGATNGSGGSSASQQ